MQLRLKGKQKFWEHDFMDKLTHELLKNIRVTITLS